MLYNILFRSLEQMELVSPSTDKYYLLSDLILKSKLDRELVKAAMFLMLIKRSATPYRMAEILVITNIYDAWTTEKPIPIILQIVRRHAIDVIEVDPSSINLSVVLTVGDEKF